MSPSHPYTSTSLARFLGWNEAKVEATLVALTVIEKGLAAEEDFEGLSTWQAEAVAKQTRRVANETNDPEIVKHVVRGLSDGMRSKSGRPPCRGAKKKGDRQRVTYHGARYEADAIVNLYRRARRPDKPPPEAWKFMGKFADEFNKFLTTKRTEKMKAVIADRENFDPGDRRMMVNVLRNLAKKLNAYANDLEAPGDGLRSGEHQEAARRAGARQLSHS